MGKIDSTYQARIDGMVYAYNLAKKDGLDVLEKEIRFRGANFLPLEINKDGIRDIYNVLATRITQTVTVMMLATLRDSLGFASTRLKRFQDDFSEKCIGVDVKDPYGEYYANISDYAKMLEEECGIDCDIETILKVEKDNGRSGKNDKQ